MAVLDDINEADETTNPALWLEQHGDYLYGYALFRLRDESLAEDSVQETLLAALQARRAFAGRSAERTWLTGILKHKIIDHFRRASRLVAWESDEEDDRDYAAQFTAGHWKAARAPGEWFATPSDLVENKEFWRVFQHCLAALPQRAAMAFTLRELEGYETAEICSILGVSANNLWVLLHRARAQLRAALEREWFRP